MARSVILHRSNSYDDLEWSECARSNCDLVHDVNCDFEESRYHELGNMDVLVKWIDDRDEWPVTEDIESHSNSCDEFKDIPDLVPMYYCMHSQTDNDISEELISEYTSDIENLMRFNDSLRENMILTMYRTRIQIDALNRQSEEERYNLAVSDTIILERKVRAHHIHIHINHMNELFNTFKTTLKLVQEESKKRRSIIRLESKGRMISKCRTFKEHMMLFILEESVRNYHYEERIRKITIDVDKYIATHNFLEHERALRSDLMDRNDLCMNENFEFFYINILCESNLSSIRYRSSRSNVYKLCDMQIQTMMIGEIKHLQSLYTKHLNSGWKCCDNRVLAYTEFTPIVFCQELTARDAFPTINPIQEVVELCEMLRDVAFSNAICNAGVTDQEQLSCLNVVNELQSSFVMLWNMRLKELSMIKRAMEVEEMTRYNQYQYILDSKMIITSQEQISRSILSMNRLNHMNCEITEVHTCEVHGMAHGIPTSWNNMTYIHLSKMIKDPFCNNCSVSRSLLFKCIADIDIKHGTNDHFKRIGLIYTAIISMCVSSNPHLPMKVVSRLLFDVCDRSRVESLCMSLIEYKPDWELSACALEYLGNFSMKSNGKP